MNFNTKLQTQQQIAIYNIDYQYIICKYKKKSSIKKYFTMNLCQTKLIYYICIIEEKNDAGRRHKAATMYFHGRPDTD